MRVLRRPAMGGLFSFKSSRKGAKAQRGEAGVRFMMLPPGTGIAAASRRVERALSHELVGRSSNGRIRVQLPHQ
jgi:hypothetical protein